MVVRSVHEGGYGHNWGCATGNRSWPAALKREIVGASFAPGASVAVVARRYEVNANQLFGWRRLYRDGSLGSADACAPSIPVTVTAEHRRDAVPTTSVADVIEIELTDRYRIRVGSAVDAHALRRVPPSLRKSGTISEPNPPSASRRSMTARSGLWRRERDRIGDRTSDAAHPRSHT
jgi:transposase